MAYPKICIIEKIHREKFILRCLSPDNIAVGTGDRARNFYILDAFGFKKYWDSRTGKHIDCIEGKPLIKDPIFASTHEHLGIEASRRDDFESLAYIALFMFLGTLPWDGDQEEDSEKDNYPLIMSRKMNATPESLFSGYPCKLA